MKVLAFLVFALAGAAHAQTHVLRYTPPPNVFPSRSTA
jgi:hypothetical protein